MDKTKMSNKPLNLAPAKRRGRPKSNFQPVESYKEIPLTGLEPASDHMSPDAKAIYEELLPDLAMRGDCSKVDKYVIEAFADSVANYRKSREILNRTSELIKNSNGNMVQNPMRFSLQGERSAMIGLAVQLRLTPKTRWVEPDKDSAETTSAGSSEDF